MFEKQMIYRYLRSTQKGVWEVELHELWGKTFVHDDFILMPANVVEECNLLIINSIPNEKKWDQIKSVYSRMYRPQSVICIGNELKDFLLERGDIDHFVSIPDCSPSEKLWLEAVSKLKNQQEVKES